MIRIGKLIMTNEQLDSAVEGLALIIALAGAIALYWQYQAVPDWLIAIIGMLIGLPVQRYAKLPKQDK